MKNIVFAAAHAEIVPDFMVFDKKALSLVRRGFFIFLFYELKLRTRKTSRMP
ncbi:hypothetical protein [Megasphaera elsdenii]|uniref:hypothetical protein n=1 Tax=Megasphaera elsdenii TaxID=907 RepID=UPI0026DC9474|nr:hypothetical protein [Megasphaera elsdenii]